MIAIGKTLWPLLTLTSNQQSIFWWCWKDRLLKKATIPKSQIKAHTIICEFCKLSNFILYLYVSKLTYSNLDSSVRRIRSTGITTTPQSNLEITECKQFPLVQFWQASEFFPSKYFQIQRQHVALIHIIYELYVNLMYVLKFGTRSGKVKKENNVPFASEIRDL